jgi:hypothetical protein
MKKIKVIAILTLLLLGISPQVKAAMAAEEASFWMFDQPGLTTGDGKITFDVFNLDYSGTFPFAVLQYKSDNSDWTSISSPEVTITGAPHKLSFRLIPNNKEPITKAGLLFKGSDESYHNGILMLWENYSDLSIIVMSNKDKLATAPIPSAVWLFGTGILGLLGLRRKLS